MVWSSCRIPVYVIVPLGGYIGGEKVPRGWDQKVQLSLAVTPYQGFYLVAGNEAERLLVQWNARVKNMSENYLSV